MKLKPTVITLLFISLVSAWDGDFQAKTVAGKNVTVLVLLGEWFGDSYFPLKEEILRRGWAMKRVGVDTEYRGCYNKARDVVLRSDILIPDLEDFSDFNCLIIPSGPQWRKFNRDQEVLKFIRKAHGAGLLIASFCVGNRTVKASGLIDASSGIDLSPKKVTRVKERILLGPKGGGPPPGDGYKSAPIKEICDAIARELEFISNNRELSLLRGPYLGQKPPGMMSKIFAPEFLHANPSWFWHGSPVFSPDGNEMYWAKYVVGEGMRLWHMVKKNEKWLAPQKAAFACDCNENNPFYSEDGNTIYYMSEKAGGPLFFVSRTSSGWSQPRNIVLQLPENTGWGWDFSFTKNLELYLGLMNNNHFDLYYAISTKGRYENFKNLGSKINSLDMETAPFIDPDKKFIIFSSNRPKGFGGADLYISFINSGDTWTESINMGIEINSASNEIWPMLTSDRKYFFFCRLDRAKKGYQPYWVDAKIIDELKPYK